MLKILYQCFFAISRHSTFENNVYSLAFVTESAVFILSLYAVSLDKINDEIMFCLQAKNETNINMVGHQ